MILHITTREAWEEAQARGAYRAASLETEGFIHCSTSAQVVGSAERFFAGQRDLVLLCIDPARLNAELRYEDPGEGQAFPHLYGELGLAAVTQAIPWGADEAGRFRLPALGEG